MPHINGRIYSEIVNGVKIGINTDDVCAVLGSASHDVKTLCMSSNINMWAKFKPEIINTYAAITLEQRRQNNFGLSPSAVYASKSAFITAVGNGTFKNGWSYAAVGANAWGRITDFDGYYHGATPPFGSLVGGQFVLTNNTLVNLMIPGLVPVNDDGCININEFEKSGADYKNWYFGVLLYMSARQFMATATQPIGTSQDWQVNFGWMNPSYAGTYKGVPFMSSKQFTVGGAEPSGVQIVGVGSAGVNIVLQSTSQSYVPFASCLYENSTTRDVSYVVSIQNTTSSAVTLTNVVLWVAQSNAGANSQTLVSFGNVTVAANQKWYTSGRVTVSTRAFQFCQLRYTGSSNTTWVKFEEPMMGPLE